ncbi:hypothetical protein ACFVW1_31165 [Streptomyces olivochromogenes]|uniref:hypothetical protein n=1 Tax=Streptomyces olivochromogenes TaxID=1963 RepID=UPI0036DF6931
MALIFLKWPPSGLVLLEPESMNLASTIVPVGAIVAACITAITTLRSVRHTAQTHARIAAEERQFKAVDGLLETAAAVEHSLVTSGYDAAPYRVFRLAHFRFIATGPQDRLSSFAAAMAQEVGKLQEVVNRLDEVDAAQAELWKDACSELTFKNGNPCWEQTEVTWSYHAAVGFRLAEKEGDLQESLHAQEELDRTVEQCGEVDWDIVEQLLKYEDEKHELETRRRKTAEKLEEAYALFSAVSGAGHSGPRGGSDRVLAVEPRS